MKKIARNNHLTQLLIALSLSITLSYGQIRLGPPTGTLDGSSSLDVESGPYPTGSAYRGLLLPLVNSTQRGQIGAPAKGLMVFNTSTNQVEVNTGTSTGPIWTPGGAGSGGGSWSLTGNAGTNANNFLGTIDANPLIFKIFGYKSGIIDPINFNTALGFRSQVNMQGNYAAKQGFANVAFGYLTLEANTTGFDNTALGTTALYTNTTGENNTAVGTGSMARNTTGSFNVAVGGNTLPFNTTGYSNMAIGVDALAENADGHDNVAVGGSALLVHHGGEGNTAVGNLALRQLSSGIFNTVVGLLAGQYSVTGDRNTFIGVDAGPASGSGVVSNAIAIGNAARVNSGNSNAIGSQAVASVGNATAIGALARVNAYNSTALGFNAAANSPNTIVLGDANITTLRCNVQTISSLSDRRIKDNVKANVPGLNFITKLNPVTYNVNKLKEAKLVGYPLASVKEDKVRHSGFIAQDVESAAKAVGYDFEGVKQEENGKYYTVGYTLFVVPLVQAVKELNAEVERLQAKLAKTEKERDSDIAKLLDRIAEVERVQAKLAKPEKEPSTDVARE
ncbi:hypothetical protein GCM10027592_22050 [Spirosoma flavus]